MSVDYLLIFDNGQYRIDPDQFAAGVESELPQGMVRRPLPSRDDTSDFISWKFGSGDEEATGRTSANGDAIFAHARMEEMAVFTQWIRHTVPPGVEVTLTNEAYSFSASIPPGATAAEITRLIH